jgi:Flp pilus assembly pilin Flp
MKRFLSDETGAMAVDWVVLTAGVVGLGLASIGVVTTGSVSLAEEVSAAFGLEGFARDDASRK